MKNLISSLILLFLFVGMASFTTSQDGVLKSKKTHNWYFPSTPLKDIVANNYKPSSSMITRTGEVIFILPLQSFDFEKALKQKYLNNIEFLNTNQFPRSEFIEKITDLKQVNFSQNGTHQVTVADEIPIKEKIKEIKKSGVLTVKEDSTAVESKYKIQLPDYGESIKKANPAFNIAKDIEINFVGEYDKD